MKYIQLRSTSNNNGFSLKLEFHNLPSSTISRYEVPRKVVLSVLKTCWKFVFVSFTLKVLL